MFLKFYEAESGLEHRFIYGLCNFKMARRMLQNTYDNDDWSLLKCNNMQSDEQLVMFWGVIVSSSAGSRNPQRVAKDLTIHQHKGLVQQWKVDWQWKIITRWNYELHVAYIPYTQKVSSSTILNKSWQQGVIKK
jgi:hypothetical protein